jgi:hypothetical protein
LNKIQTAINNTREFLKDNGTVEDIKELSVSGDAIL